MMMTFRSVQTKINIILGWIFGILHHELKRLILSLLSQCQGGQGLNKTRLLGLIVFMVSASLLLSACGPKSVILDVEMKEFAFIPDRFTVPAGAKVTLKLKNTGALEHEFVIMVFGKEATLPFNEDDEANIYWEAELDARENAIVEFTAPSEPGEYQVVCGTPGHLEQNMKGVLVVTP